MNQNKRSFKLIKSYPNSLKLGAIISDEYTITLCKADSYPEYWEEIEYVDYVIDYYGNIIDNSSFCFAVRDVTKNKISRITALEVKYLTEDQFAFKTHEDAVKFLSTNIDLKINQDIIIGENVRLIGINTNTWQEVETNSFNVYYGKQSRADHWKYFRFEEDKNKYLFHNKPILSLNDIDSVISEDFYVNDDKMKIIQKIYSIAKERIDNN